MSTARKLLLILLAVALLAGAIATWGSIGSIMLVFCLGTMLASLLYQHFLTNRDDNDFEMGQ